MSANQLQIAATKGKKGIVLALSGRVSVDSSPILRNRLLAALRSHTDAAVIVDLTNTASVDCSGIATLIEALKIARHRQLRLQLVGLHGRLKNLFEITGVLSLFQGRSHTSASFRSEEF